MNNYKAPKTTGLNTQNELPKMFIVSIFQWLFFFLSDTRVCLKYTFHIFRQRTVAYKRKTYMIFTNKNWKCGVQKYSAPFLSATNKKKKNLQSLSDVDLTSPPVCNLISGVPEQVTSVIYHFVPEQHHNVGRAAFDHLQLGEGKIPQMHWRVVLVQYYCFLVTCSFNTPSSRFLQWNTTFPEKEHKNVLRIVGFSLWSQEEIRGGGAQRPHWGQII